MPAELRFYPLKRQDHDQQDRYEIDIRASDFDTDGESADDDMASSSNQDSSMIRQVQQVRGVAVVDNHDLDSQSDGEEGIDHPSRDRVFASGPVNCTFHHCVEIFTSFYEMKIHKKDVHDYCVRCDMDFTEEEDLIKHKARSRQHIACDHCGLDFTQESSFKSHVQLLHRKKQQIVCPGQSCRRVFPNIASFFGHIESSRCRSIPSQEFHAARDRKKLYYAILSHQDRRDFEDHRIVQNAISTANATGQPLSKQITDYIAQYESTVGPLQLSDWSSGANNKDILNTGESSKDDTASPHQPSSIALQNYHSTNLQLLSSLDSLKVFECRRNAEKLDLVVTKGGARYVPRENRYAIKSTNSPRSGWARRPVDDSCNWTAEIGAGAGSSSWAESTTTHSGWNDPEQKKTNSDWNTENASEEVPNSLGKIRLDISDIASWDPFHPRFTGSAYYCTSTSQYMCGFWNCSFAALGRSEIMEHLQGSKHAAENGNECHNCDMRYRTVGQVLQHYTDSRKRCDVRQSTEKLQRIINEFSGGFLKVIRNGIEFKPGDDVSTSAGRQRVYEKPQVEYEVIRPELPY